jgi:hypothetical protein
LSYLKFKFQYIKYKLYFFKNNDISKSNLFFYKNE